MNDKEQNEPYLVLKEVPKSFQLLQSACMLLPAKRASGMRVMPGSLTVLDTVLLTRRCAENPGSKWLLGPSSLSVDLFYRVQKSVGLP